MRKLLLTLSATILMAATAYTPVWSDQAPTTTPMQTMRSLGDEILAIVRSPSCTSDKPGCSKRLRELVESHWDLVEMSRSALGVHWKALSQVQREEFARLFGNLIETLYINKANLSEAQAKASKGIQVNYLREIAQGDGYSQVNTTVMLQGNDKPVDVSYRLKVESSEWKVYDVIVAGISLVGNYRNQFTRIINRDGYPALVQDLRNKLDQLKSQNS